MSFLVEKSLQIFTNILAFGRFLESPIIGLTWLNQQISKQNKYTFNRECERSHPNTNLLEIQRKNLEELGQNGPIPMPVLHKSGKHPKQQSQCDPHKTQLNSPSTLSTSGTITPQKIHAQSFPCWKGNSIHRHFSFGGWIHSFILGINS